MELLMIKLITTIRVAGVIVLPGMIFAALYNTHNKRG